MEGGRKNTFHKRRREERCTGKRGERDEYSNVEGKREKKINIVMRKEGGRKYGQRGKEHNYGEEGVRRKGDKEEARERSY